MNIVYFIQCHKNLEQVIFLVDSLKLSESDKVVIHVDGKNRKLNFLLRSHYYNSIQVFIINNPISVSWSGFSQVQATLKMIDFVYVNNICFDYCCLLSGEDIVLNVESFKSYLTKYSGLSFIEFRDDREKYFWRINKFNFWRESRFSQKFFVRALSSFFIKVQSLLGVKRSNFDEDEIHIGSQWFTISRQHMDLFYRVMDKEYLRRYKYTSCADEHFFQMLFKSCVDPLEYRGINLRFIDFPYGSSSPRYLSIADLNSIKDIADIFIARKVTFHVASSFFRAK
ncbi:beta-1,6-N-acetylglucosaminyltransferase [Aeromonas caviae]